MLLFYRMKQYDNRTKGMGQIHDTLSKQLTEVEKKLVVSQEVVEIRGKVSPVLCSSDYFKVVITL